MITAAAGDPGSWRLVTPTADHAEAVAGWSRSAEEAAAWVSRAEHPFPAAAVRSWWEGDDVHPWLLVDPGGAAVAYGELWDDDEEDEVELARLIVDPARRRHGVGRRLVDRLVDRARDLGRGACFLRVAPGNVAALALYRSAGFVDVNPDQAAAWNQFQPVAYCWLELPDFVARS